MFNKLVIFIVGLSNINESIAAILVAIVLVVAVLVLLLALLAILLRFTYRTDEDAGDQEWQQTKKGDR